MAPLDPFSKRSRELFDRAREIIPGGVNSPVRAFRAVGGVPPFIRRGQGATIEDEDGRAYIDLVGSWGPLILGHAHPEVLEALEAAAANGTSFGAPTAAEVELAEVLVEAVPSIESVRLVNSGTEATLSAVRLARAATERSRLIKFEGCYHGHGDSFLIQAGSGAATLGQPSSPGVTEGTARDTLCARYNDLDSVAELLSAHAGQVAAVIVEPVAANMGLVLPEPGFLEGLRRLCDSSGALLIFDEVITGFRLALGGAQQRFDILPDLTTLGKVIGGGLPVGAYGGRRDLMERLAPVGPVYQAGTLSGNPLAVAAGLTTLRLLEDGSVHRQLEALGGRLSAGMERTLEELALPVSFVSVASLGCLYFRRTCPRNWQEAAEADTERFARYFSAMLERGIYLAPSQYETAFSSAAHGPEQIDRIVAASRESLEEAFA